MKKEKDRGLQCDGEWSSKSEYQNLARKPEEQSTYSKAFPPDLIKYLKSRVDKRVRGPLPAPVTKSAFACRKASRVRG